MREKLTVQERGRFEHLKERIAERLDTCFEVGRMLKEIKDSKLYKEDFDTWEAFCQSEYKIGQRKSLYLIAAYETQEILKKANETSKQSGTIVPLLTNSEQARELNKAPKEIQVEVIQSVARKGPVTGAAIAGEVKARAAKPVTSAIRLDGIGRPIPEEIIPEWDRAEKLGDRLRSCVSEVKCALEHGINDKDLIFGEMSNEHIDDAAQLYFVLSQILPHSVCTDCHAKKRESCKMCRGRGWISKSRFDLLVPKSVRMALAKTASL